MIAYKVVTKDRKSRFLGQNEEMFRGKKLKKYLLIYEKGKIVKAPKRTAGIFCFDSREGAREFSSGKIGTSLILKVKSLSKPKKIKPIPADITRIVRFLQGEDVQCINWIPKGTICFDKVKVLD